VRLGSGGAKLVLGCDFVVSASQKTMDTTREGTRMVVNTHQQMTGEFTRNANIQFPGPSLKRTITKGVGEANAEFVEATRIATALIGDSIATNLFMLGYAFQKGLVPVSSEAINKAIELNGAAVKMNQAAFLWGRRAAVDLAAIERLIAPKTDVESTTQLSHTLEQTVARRAAFLTGYQDAAYAEKYRNLVERVKQAESTRTKGLTGLSEAVARYYFKLLAYKDEYEVARLYADPAFMQKIKSQFEGDYKLHFHLAPPLLAKRDPTTGELRKKEYGTWMFTAFKVLSKLRGLRGTAFDIFGYTQERRMERQLIGEYEATIEELLGKLSSDNHALAVKIAAVPEEIRGYGHIKDRNLGIAKAKEGSLLAAFRSPEPVRSAA
jgi:indolepyruvate ferredoxin oxidoreductase